MVVRKMVQCAASPLRILIKNSINSTQGPIKIWGHGIVNPVDMAECEHQTSVKITEELVGLFYRQVTSLKKLDKVKIKGRVMSLKLAKELRLNLNRD